MLGIDANTIPTVYRINVIDGKTDVIFRHTQMMLPGDVGKVHDALVAHYPADHIIEIYAA
jgi:hypothetical protein